jgi:8-hydroxy-5-deazaflavin:NADPH oxidoreductase
VLCSRTGPDALAGKVAELERGASAATVEEAASLDYVLLAVPWNNIEAALRGLPEWNGRVLIDTPTLRRDQPQARPCRPRRYRRQRDRAGFARGVRIVKAFNSILVARFNEGPVKGQGKRVISLEFTDRCSN